MFFFWFFLLFVLLYCWFGIFGYCWMIFLRDIVVLLVLECVGKVWRSLIWIIIVVLFWEVCVWEWIRLRGFEYEDWFCRWEIKLLVMDINMLFEYLYLLWKVCNFVNFGIKYDIICLFGREYMGKNWKWVISFKIYFFCLRWLLELIFFFY